MLNLSRAPMHYVVPSRANQTSPLPVQEGVSGTIPPLDRPLTWVEGCTFQGASCIPLNLQAQAWWPQAYKK